MEKQSFDLHELFQQVLLEAHAAWRYRWHALIVAWCVAVAGVLLVMSMPDQYRAQAQVYANTDSLVNPLLHGIAVHPDIRKRINVVTHTLLSRPNLEKVADKTGLSLRADTPADKDKLVATLAQRVKVRGAGTRDLYNISYSGSDPETAKTVVQTLVQVLMNDTLGANTASNRSAQLFLKKQVADYSDRLDQAEKKLAAFKKANVGYIPSQGGSDYFTRLQGAQTKLQALQARYDTAASSRAATRQQMHDMANNSGSGAGINPRTQQIDTQISTYQHKLDELLLKYTDKYPEVTSTKRMIKQLQKRRANILKSSATEGGIGGATTNPVYQQMQANLYNAKLNMHTLGTQIGQQKSQIAHLKKQVNKITDVQNTLKHLTRNYNTTKSQYNQLVKHLNTAEMSEAATQNGNNLKFQVINPPVVPAAPIGPKRGLYLLVVFVFAIGIGGAFAYFLHLIRPVFTSLKSLHDFTDYPVIGTFGQIVSQARKRARRREIMGFGAGVGLLAVVLVLTFAFSADFASAVQHVFAMGVT